jgi:hypothetical protein
MKFIKLQSETLNANKKVTDKKKKIKIKNK